MGDDARRALALSFGPRRKLTFKRTADPPFEPEPSRLPGIEAFLNATEDVASSPEQVAVKLLEVKAAHDEQVRSGALELTLKASSVLCSCWTCCLSERERRVGDAGEVAVHALQRLVEGPTLRCASILLDGLSRVKFAVSAAAARVAAAILASELAADVLHTEPCVDLWIDIARQFRLGHVDYSAWLQCRDKLLHGQRWGEVAELCRVVGMRVDLLDRVFSQARKHHDELVGFAPRLSPRSQGMAVRRLADAGSPQLADRVRRACGQPCAPELLRRLRLDLLAHLVRLGLCGRALDLAAAAGLSSEISDMLPAAAAAGQARAGPRGLPGACAPSPTVNASSAPSWLIDAAAVRLVDSEAGAASCAAAMSSAEGPVGLDCEWPPAEQRVSLVQIALGEVVWIVDLYWVLKSGQLEVVEALRQLLANDCVTKLGYGFQVDLDRLDISLLQCGGLGEGVCRLVDLQTDNRGLGALLHSTTGLCLDKTMQCSAWESRPLSHAQLRYAATDAHCLLKIYAALSHPPAPCNLSPRRPERQLQPGQGGPAAALLTVSHVKAALLACSAEAQFVQSSQPLGDDEEEGNVVCFIVKPEQRPVAVVTRGTCKVSVPALAKVLRVGKSKVALASAADCVALFGFAPGAVPPVGLRAAVSVWLSTHLVSDRLHRLRFSAGSSDVGLLMGVDALTACHGDGRWLPDRERSLVPLAEQLHRIQRGDMPPAFVCDSMLNRLAHKLRALDLDVVVVGDSQTPGPQTHVSRPLPPACRPVRPTVPQRRTEEEQLLDLTECGRAALTSSSSTLAALHGYVYLLHGLTVDEQVREVCAVFGIDAQRRAGSPLDRRCCMCNGGLRQIDRAEAAGKVLEQTLQAYDVFFECVTPSCERIFWHGSTFEEGVQDIRHAVEGILFDP